MGFFDFVLGYGRVIASSVSGAARAVLVNVAGIGDGETDAELAAKGQAAAGKDHETSTNEPLFGAVGVVARPRPPTVDGVAEVLFARTEDGLQPVAGRDLRQMARVNPKDGDVNLAHDAGGFIALQDSGDTIGSGAKAGLPKGTSITLLAPALTDAGVIEKSHAIRLDTKATENAVTIVHALGMAIVMTKDGELVLRSDTGEARIVLKGDQITMQAQKIIAQGNVVVGANPVGALQLLAGSASPACPFLFLSQPPP